MTLPRSGILCTLADMRLPANDILFEARNRPSSGQNCYTTLYHSFYTIRGRKWAKMGLLLRLTRTLKSTLSEVKALEAY